MREAAHIEIVPVFGGDAEVLYRVVDGLYRGTEFHALLELYEFGRDHDLILDVQARHDSAHDARSTNSPNAG